MRMIKAKIVGAGGYGGVGLLELLLGHPEAEAVELVDIESAGTPIANLYPHLKNFTDLVITDSASEDVDVVFMATPDRVGMTLASDELEKGVKVIDYSGDFRFNTPEAYSEYASRIGLDTDHCAEDLLKEAVYGLTELHRKAIVSGTRVIGNPGCFAVSCILGLSPALKNSLIESDGIICDCKTGVSGAGKNPSPAFHYPARYDNMNAYKLTGHQHVCEIERELGLLAETDIKVTFTSQVVPVCRGIMSTLYGDMREGVSEPDVVEAYKAFYSDDNFVRVFGSGVSVGSMDVRGTNYCNLVVSVDTRTGKLRVVSYIDNLVKGQAGSALQNMNLLFDLPESAGLSSPGKHP
jgi:N-acetyl-gamma-glutamyl-phosphate reductase